MKKKIWGDDMKKWLKLLLLTGLLSLPVGILHVQAESAVSVSDNKDGTVSVEYDNTAGKKIAVMVVKTGTDTKYNYFSTDRKVNIDVPLTLGNGKYTVSVLKNISGTSYSPLCNQEVSLKLSDANKAYLTSNQVINWNTKNSAIKKANSLTKKCKTEYAKIKKVYKYIVKNYHYDYAKLAQNQAGQLTNYIPDIEVVYKEKKGICYDISALNASMLRSLGIKTKLVKGYPVNKYYNGTVYHAWNKVYNKKTKKWIVIDATCDMCLYEQGAKFKISNMKKKASQYSRIYYEY